MIHKIIIGNILTSIKSTDRILDMVGIVNYNAGNIKSVERALNALNAEYTLSSNPKELEKCNKIIFPGVGEAKYAMTQLKNTGFDIFLKEWALANKPLLGICLGSQIIFEYSEEGDTECLGILKGKIKEFKNVWLNESSNTSLKVPHMGWNNLKFANGSSKVFTDIPENSDFYFVHSYLIQPEDKSIIKAYCDYGCVVPACIEKDSVTAFQFHPEKSGVLGLKLLENFIKLG